MGRLSGPALLAVDWTHGTPSRMPHAAQRVVSETYSGESGTVIGTLTNGESLSPDGVYYVEILSIFCFDFSQNMTYDFTNDCVHAMGQARTGPARLATGFVNVSSIVQETLGGFGSKGIASGGDADTAYTKRIGGGSWHLGMANSSSSGVPGMVHTRHQPPPCFGETATSLPSCAEFADLTRFEQFVWQWHSSHNTGGIDNTSSVELQQWIMEYGLDRPAISLCLVGLSHSRELLYSFRRLHLRQINQTRWVNARYPTDITRDFIMNKDMGSCQHVVVGVGQWPASFKGGWPTQFLDYSTQIISMLQTLTELMPGTKIWARSIHYNPINQRIGRCPPSDWRSPAVIDGYNSIIANACRSFGELVKFIDTNHIIKPMWDSAPDWCHFNDSVSDIEALYIAAVVLGAVVL